MAPLLEPDEDAHLPDRPEGGPRPGLLLALEPAGALPVDLGGRTPAQLDQAIAVLSAEASDQKRQLNGDRRRPDALAPDEAGTALFRPDTAPGSAADGGDAPGAVNPEFDYAAAFNDAV